MKLGARSFKTGLAVALSIILAQLLSVESGVIAGISAVSSTQPSVARSYKYLKERLMANAIGGLLAAIVAWSLGTNVVIIGLAVVLLIAILNYLKLSNVISLSVVTMVIIMMSTGDNLLLTAVLRVSETFIGVIVAFLVNTFIHPPQYGDKLYHTVDYVTSEFLIWIRAGLRKNTNFAIMNKDLKWSVKQLSKIDLLFQFIQESRLPFRKPKIDELREIVVYRRMISSTKAAYKVLRVLHDYENAFFNYPLEMRVLIRQRMETLMSGHEQILLKFSGRIPPGQVNFFEANKDVRKTLIDSFFANASIESDEQDKLHQKGFGGIHLMSAILTYEDELVRFNKLVSNYRSQPRDHQISNLEDIMQ